MEFKNLSKDEARNIVISLQNLKRNDNNTFNTLFPKGDTFIEKLNLQILDNTCDRFPFLIEDINLYIMDLKGENRYLYLNIVDHSKIDDFKIDSIQATSLPSISLLQKINTEIYMTSNEEITSIKKYFPQSPKVKINHQKFKANTEEELIEYMKNLVNTN